MSTYQLLDIVTVNRVIQTLIYRIAEHPWIKFPVILDDTGKAVKINKFRNFDGKVLNNPSGITLSVFPYHYGNDSGKEQHNTTVGSKNSSMQFNLADEKGTLGANGQDVTAYNVVNLNVKLKLDLFGYSNTTTQNNQIVKDQETTFDLNYKEWLLRQYTDILYYILSDNRIRRLPSLEAKSRYLLDNSWVDTIDFPTSSVTAGANTILHSASIIWQAKYYVPREWKLPTHYVPVDLTDGLLFLGETMLAGVATKVYYDTVGLTFVDVNRNILTRSQLNVGTSLSESLNADMVELIDSAPKGMFDFSIFLKRVDHDWT